MLQNLSTLSIKLKFYIITSIMMLIVWINANVCNNRPNCSSKSESYENHASITIKQQIKTQQTKENNNKIHQYWYSRPRKPADYPCFESGQ